MTFEQPEFGAPLAAAHPSPEAIELLRLRRSTSAELLTDPGPDARRLQSMLQIAARVPDHRRVFPFRFLIFEGEARAAAGDVLADAFKSANPTADEKHIEIERRRFLRAPTIIAIVSRIDRNHKTPEWEQTLTLGAVGQNLLIAASAHGFAANWITEWCAYDRNVLESFGLRPEEAIAGFVYVGTAREAPKERLRPELSAIVSHFAGKPGRR